MLGKWEKWNWTGALRCGLHRQQHKAVLLLLLGAAGGGHGKAYSRHGRLCKGPVRNTVHESKTDKLQFCQRVNKEKQFTDFKVQGGVNVFKLFYQFNPDLKVWLAQTRKPQRGHPEGAVVPREVGHQVDLLEMPRKKDTVAPAFPLSPSVPSSWNICVCSSGCYRFRRGETGGGKANSRSMLRATSTLFWAISKALFTSSKAYPSPMSFAIFASTFSIAASGPWGFL